MINKNKKSSFKNINKHKKFTKNIHKFVILKKQLFII